MYRYFHFYWKTKAVFVSLGLDVDVESSAVSSDNGDPDVGSRGELLNANSLDHSASHSTSQGGVVGGREFPTVLSSSGPFLQLNGRSSVEVDESGIFISIPTLQNSPSSPGHGANQSTSPSNRLPNGNLSQSAIKKSPAVKRATRRGLRIPACSGIKVSCVQPLSLVMTLPITRKALLANDSAPNSPVPSETAGEIAVADYQIDAESSGSNSSTAPVAVAVESDEQKPGTGAR